MDKIKKYMSITRLGHRSTGDVLKKGDHITISEKIDGANSSFNEFEGNVLGFSRRLPITPTQTLQGFYDFIVKLKAEDLLPNMRYYGEWTAKHKIDYGENLKKFYLFDIWDEEKEQFLPSSFVRSEASRIGLNLAPIFYEGSILILNTCKAL